MGNERRPVRHLVLLLVVALVAPLAGGARPADAASSVLATDVIDANGDRWDGVVYTPATSGPHTFTIAKSNASAVTGLALRQVDGNVWLDSVAETGGATQSVSADLGAGVAVRIGFWAASGATDYTLTVDTPGGDGDLVSSGIRDDDGQLGPRYASSTWTAPRSGTVAFELSWSGSGSLRFVVREQVADTWVTQSPLGGSSPQRFDAEVTAGVTYRIPVWATSGWGDHTMSVRYLDGGGGGGDPQPTRVGRTGRNDASGNTAPVSTSVPATVSDAGTLYVSLDYEQSDGELHLRLFDGAGALVAATLTEWTAKGIERQLAPGDYTVEVRAASGAADWSLEIYVEPDRPRPAAPVGRPNIVVINTDDQRADSLMHLPQITSWFVDDGVNFTNGYVTTPSCCPSRAALFSGQFNHNNGVVGQHVPGLDQNRTVQRYLTDAGYFTAFAGKFVHYWPQQLTAPHWDRWTYFKGGYYNTWINSDGVNRREPGNSTIRTFSQGIQYLEEFRAEDDARPWFLHLTPVAPHKPSTPEPQYAAADVAVRNWTPNINEVDRSDKPPFVQNRERTAADTYDLRRDMIRTLYTYDDQVDRLMEYLRDSGELSNTLIILTSDNGYLWGEHRLDEKFVPYDAAIRVPFLVYWQGRVTPGTTDDRWVANIDIAPTVLSAAGVAVPTWMDGADVLSGFDRQVVFTEYFRDESNSSSVPGWKSVRTDTWVYTEYYAPDETTVEFREYYNLAVDPHQLNNLLEDGFAGNDPSLDLPQQLLEQYATCAGASCRP